MQMLRAAESMSDATVSEDLLFSKDELRELHKRLEASCKHKQLSTRLEKRHAVTANRADHKASNRSVQQDAKAAKTPFATPRTSPPPQDMQTDLCNTSGDIDSPILAQTTAYLAKSDGEGIAQKPSTACNNHSPTGHSSRSFKWQQSYVPKVHEHQHCCLQGMHCQVHHQLSSDGSCSDLPHVSFGMSCSGTRGGNMVVEFSLRQTLPKNDGCIILATAWHMQSALLAG